MEKLIASTLGLAVCLGTTALLANRGRPTQPSQGANAPLASDGAFRDGLYLGRLTAESGRTLRPPTGRWASDKDRAAFVAGYRRGYNDSVASVKHGG